jgi:hypothetical protein
MRFAQGHALNSSKLFRIGSHHIGSWVISGVIEFVISDGTEWSGSRLERGSRSVWVAKCIPSA